MSRNILLRSRKVAHGLTSALAFRALRAGVGVAVEHSQVLGWLAPDTVVDAGANRGQFSLMTRVKRPEATIIAFEPLSAPRAKLKAMFERDQHFRCEPYALGVETARLEMKVTQEDDSSSLRSVSDLQESLFGTREATTEFVEVRPLTAVLGLGDLKGRTLLKIDVQGFELELLRGAQPLLSAFDSVYVEASFVRLYTGQALVPELVAFLAEQGFGMRGLFNQAWDDRFGPVQADFLFQRS